MAKTRGVFGVIALAMLKAILLSERMDGKGWNLPGGRVEAGENDGEALVREVREETGLEVEMLEQIGPEHVFGEDTAVSYFCMVVGGKLLEHAPEAQRIRYCTMEEVQAGRIRVNLGGEITGAWVPLKLVGPEGRLGRMGRMLFDGYSTMAPAQIIHSADLVVKRGIYVAADGCHLVADRVDGQWIWPRFDPYSPTGIMQPPS